MPPTTVTLERLLRTVDLDVGNFAVGMMTINPEVQKSIRDGTAPFSKELERGITLDDDNVSRGSIFWRLLVALFPLSILISMARGITSTHRFKHCEVAFFTREGYKHKLIAVGVHGEKDGVFIEPREFHDEYEWSYVKCTKHSLVAMLSLAIELQGIPFTRSGMSKSQFAPGPNNDDGFFCSQLTMKMLSLLPHPVAQLNRPNVQNVDDIFAIIQGDDFRATNVVQMPAVHIKQIFHDSTVINSDAVRVKAPKGQVYST